MRSFRDLAKPKRPPTANEQLAIDDVYELANGFTDGTVAIAEIRATSSGKQRALATAYTDTTDPMFPKMMAMLDALIADSSDKVITDAKGVMFDRSDLAEVQAKLVRHDGQHYIQFPVAYPWKTKPDKDGGVAGERVTPIYRGSNAEDELDKAIFYREKIEPYEKEWWETEDDAPSDPTS